MDLIWVFVLIILIYFSIKELKNTKKLQNDSVYNIYQNSRFYRLLFIVIACVIGIVLFVISQIMILFDS